MITSERERSASELATNTYSGWRRYASSALVLALWAAAGCSPTPPPPSGPITTAVVEHVVDGDTVDVQIGEGVERVRLIGVDAPESVARNVPVQCFGAEASAALTELLPPGTVVEIRRDAEARDRYGRLLLYLYVANDGVFVNGWLIESGLAEAVSYEPNVAAETYLTRARHHAARERVGLWAACDGPDQPLD